MIGSRVLPAIGRQLLRSGERVLALPTRTRLAYIGGAGDGNLGDDAMSVMASRLLPRARLVPYSFPAQERRLALLGLSGRRFFDGAILGGGTFINPAAVGPVSTALDQGLELFSLGTGVGSFGFAMTTNPTLEPWVTLLRRFEAIGVRGPRSKNALERLGVTGVEVTGDLALAFAPSEPAARSERRPCFAVNVTLPPPQQSASWGAERLIRELVRTLQRLERLGLEPLFVGMHESDRPALEQLVRAVGRPDAPLHFPRSAEQFIAFVGPCAFTIAVRLHAAVLSACAGVPPLSLGYRDKCLDFMESVELADWHLALDGDELGALEERATQLADAAAALRTPLHRRARAYGDRLRSYVRRLRPNDSV